MKRVSLTLDLLVSDDTEYVAVDKGGWIDGYKEEPIRLNYAFTAGPHLMTPVECTNWKDTLTKISKG